MMSQRPGGWPLTMFLTPGQEPFFGGTCFPKAPRYGLPGFAELLPRVAQFYRTERAQITRQGEAMVGGFERMQPANPAHHSEFSSAPLDLALENLAASYDARFGGFCAAPKFPVIDLELCCEHMSQSGSANLTAAGTEDAGVAPDKDAGGRPARWQFAPSAASTEVGASTISSAAVVCR